MKSRSTVRDSLLRCLFAAVLAMTSMAATCITTPDASASDANLVGTWDYQGTYTYLSGSYFCTIEGVLDLTPTNVNPEVKRGSFVGRISCGRDASGPIWQQFQDQVSYSVSGNELWMLFQSGELCENGGIVQDGEREVLGKMQAIVGNYCGAPGQFRMYNRR